MNNELMEILNVIQDGLRESNKKPIKSAADNICDKLDIWECQNNGTWECGDCPIGYRNNDGYGTQIIQVFKNI